VVGRRRACDVGRRTAALVRARARRGGRNRLGEWEFVIRADGFFILAVIKWDLLDYLRCGASLDSAFCCRANQETSGCYWASLGLVRFYRNDKERGLFHGSISFSLFCSDRNRASLGFIPTRFGYSGLFASRNKSQRLDLGK